MANAEPAESEKQGLMLQSLKPGAADYGPLAFRALVSMVPGAGPILAGIVESLPGQRLDRMATVVRYVLERLAVHEAAVLELLDRDVLAAAAPERVEILRSGLAAAADTTSDDRLRRLARVIAEGISAPEDRAQGFGRLLSSLDALDDEEILVLKAVERFGMVGLEIASSSAPYAQPAILAEPQADFPGLPTELQSRNSAELYLILGRLAAASLLEGGSTIMLGNGNAGKSFVISPAGVLLLSATDPME